MILVLSRITPDLGNMKVGGYRQMSLGSTIFHLGMAAQRGSQSGSEKKLGFGGRTVRLTYVSTFTVHAARVARHRS